MAEQRQYRLRSARLSERSSGSAAHGRVTIAQSAAERRHCACVWTFAERDRRRQAQAPLAITQPWDQFLAQRGQAKAKAGIQRGQPDVEIRVIERGAGQTCAAPLGEIAQLERRAPAHVY